MIKVISAFRFNNIIRRLRPIRNSHVHFSTTLSHTPSVKRKISYITDVEGDAKYFDRFVNNSQILQFEECQPKTSKDGFYFPYSHHVVFKSSTSSSSHNDDDNDQNVLVFGGDVWDKGGNDLYVIRQLLSLEQRYGSQRVHFILGNRDINKMRILQEIGLPKTKLPPHDGIYYMKGRNICGDPDCIQEYKDKFTNNHKNCNDGNPSTENEPTNVVEKKNDKEEQSSNLFQELSSKLVPSQNASERLKWILRSTMGSPDAFELRRGELKQEQPSAEDITDEQVVQSYQQSSHPVYGEMGQFLQKGKLSLKLGNVMFLHGALPFTAEYLQEQNKDNDHDVFQSGTFYSHAMPWSSKQKQQQSDILNADDWIQSMNEFCKMNSNAWKANIRLREEKLQSNGDMDDSMWVNRGGYDDDDGTFVDNPYGSLLQYGMGWLPSKTKNPTVVYDSWIQDGMPSRFMNDNNDEETQTYRQLVYDFFNSNKLQLILSGHQPIGDMPLPIQIQNTKNDDTSNEEQSPRFIVCCDTSYSGDTHWTGEEVNDDNNNPSNPTVKRKNLGRGTSLSGRGDVAVSEVLMEQCCDSGEVLSLKTHGVLSDGNQYESVNFMDSTNPDVKAMIGKQVGNSTELVFENGDTFPQNDEDNQNKTRDWWVKSKLKDGSFFLSSGEGWNVYNSIAKKIEKSAS